MGRPIFDDDARAMRLRSCLYFAGTVPSAGDYGFSDEPSLYRRND